MKRLSTVLALIAFGLVTAGAQIRPLVPIVRPVLHEKTKVFILDLAESMAKDGYDDASDYLKAWAEGGFGSGFVIVEKDGRNLVITNRHVVAQAETATLEFEGGDGSTVTYKDCPVVGVSETLDIAIIGFPEGVKPFAKGLSIGSRLPEDGSDVLSAGFPGLLSRPSWQFGKGSVTNNKARIPELADPAETVLIQHSAPIDPGSSGGPLVVANPSAYGGYEVIGINTWKVNGRQDTNFAIPGTAMRAFIDQALKPSSVSPKEALASRVAAFVAAAAAPEDAYKGLDRFVSYDLVSRSGERYLKNALASAPTKVRDSIVEKFVGVSPVEGLRLAIAYGIAEALKAGPALRFDGAAAVTEGDGSSVVELARDGGSLQTRWIREHGYWRLETFPEPEAASAGDTKDKKGKEKKAGEKGVELVSPFDAGVSLGVTAETGSYGFKMGSLGLTLPLFDGSSFLAFRNDISVGAHSYESTDIYDPGEKTTLVISFLGSLVAQLPVRLGDLYIVPYVKPGVGFVMTTSLDIDLGGATTALAGGLYVTPPGWGWSLGAEYSRWSCTSMDALLDSGSGDTEKQTMNAVTVYATMSLFY
ncbi:MAG: hypothetical protein CVV47_15790 [Spirochaetae bacterium HGW-Spirochaetae-3]|jgi:serine protease Do|nr:MAG: hypothetical protein CVV47_15790 [Spirochaetae bacterium HGW-Spirochaetae-3]